MSAKTKRAVVDVSLKAAVAAGIIAYYYVMLANETIGSDKLTFLLGGF